MRTGVAMVAGVAQSHQGTASPARLNTRMSCAPRWASLGSRDIEPHHAGALAVQGVARPQAAPGCRARKTPATGGGFCALTCGALQACKATRPTRAVPGRAVPRKCGDRSHAFSVPVPGSLTHRGRGRRQTALEVSTTSISTPTAMNATIRSDPPPVGQVHHKQFQNHQAQQAPRRSIQTDRAAAHRPQHQPSANRPTEWNSLPAPEESNSACAFQGTPAQWCTARSQTVLNATKPRRPVPMSSAGCTRRVPPAYLLHQARAPHRERIPARARATAISVGLSSGNIMAADVHCHRNAATRSAPDPTARARAPRAPKGRRRQNPARANAGANWKRDCAGACRQSQQDHHTGHEQDHGGSRPCSCNCDCVAPPTAGHCRPATRSTTRRPWRTQDHHARRPTVYPSQGDDMVPTPAATTASPCPPTHAPAPPVRCPP